MKMEWIKIRKTLTTVLLTVAESWPQPKCPPTDEWVKRWSVHTLEYRVQP